MRIIPLLTCSIAFLLCNPLLKADVLLQPNDRVAICGDGMTADWSYSLYLEDYLLMEEPLAGLDVAQFGWMANDPVGFLARINADLLPYKPTVALVVS
jgi:hypothetical protein